MGHDKDNAMLMDMAAHNCWQKVQALMQTLTDQEPSQTEPVQIKAHFELMEKGARTSVALIKAINDAHEYNKRMEEAVSQKAYTRYEDLPPLDPEDFKRLRQRFNHLANTASIKRGLGPFTPDPIED